VSGHWSSHENWVGFVLLLAPTSGLSVDCEELHRRVKRWVRGNVDLADVTAVAHSLEVTTGDNHDASMIARALDRAATTSGHLIAPRVVFGCVVVDDSVEEARRLADRLAEEPRLDDLPVYFFGVGARPNNAADDPDGRPAERSEPDPALVDVVVGHLYDVVEAYERLPTFAITEAQYQELNERRISGVATPARSALPAPPVPGPRKPAPHTSRKQLALESRPASEPPEPTELPRHGTDDEPEIIADDANESSDDRPPLDVAGAFRKVFGKLGGRENKLSELELLDRVAAPGGGVELCYLVLVADVTRKAPAQQRDLTLAIDRQIGAIREESGRSIATATFTAGRRLRRVGPLRAAGQLTKHDVPRLPAEHFDVVDCVNDLLDVANRDTAALYRRGTNVSKVQVCLLSSTAPLADMGAVERIETLCQQASVTWLLLGVDPALMSAAFSDAGVLVLEDHPDVVGELIDRVFTPMPDTPRHSATAHNGEPQRKLR